MSTVGDFVKAGAVAGVPIDRAVIMYAVVPRTSAPAPAPPVFKVLAVAAVLAPLPNSATIGGAFTQLDHA